ncbi:MAG TPA: hypothetical protein DEB31_11445 [Clostridiales bacterium]|nr:hypothetical protein [Clostridiales bacterium]
MTVLDKDRRELFNLIDFCRIYNYDIGKFEFGKGVEKPDLQSEELGIGIECTDERHRRKGSF